MGKLRDKMSGDQITDWIAEELEKREREQLDLEEFLGIVLGDERYLLPLKDIEEIQPPVEVVSVSMAPEHFIGLANIHGDIACVIDPCKVMNLKTTLKEKSESTRFVRMRNSRMRLVIMIDEATDVYSVNKNDAIMLKAEEGAFFQGVVTINGQQYSVINSQSISA